MGFYFWSKSAFVIFQSVIYKTKISTIMCAFNLRNFRNPTFWGVFHRDVQQSHKVFVRWRFAGTHFVSTVAQRWPALFGWFVFFASLWKLLVLFLNHWILAQGKSPSHIHLNEIRSNWSSHPIHDVIVVRQDGNGCYSFL